MLSITKPLVAALLALLVSSDALPQEPDFTPPPALSWRGVNLAGAEFGASYVPGIYGRQYIYPIPTAPDYFMARGMNIVRLPFLWERLQPTLNRPLDQAELVRIKFFVAAATGKGMTVILDPHSYGRYRQGLIGSKAVPNSAFANFWSRLSAVFKTNPMVIFGLMNEPSGISSEPWVAAANMALRSIRAAGAKNVVLVPGTAWTGAQSWSANWYGTPNAVAMKKLVDPASNVLIEVHQYLDGDSSGTSASCVSPTIGAERLAGFTAWLRENHRRGFLAEFAGGANPTCAAALTGMLEYMRSNQDVWAGWTYWAAGPWWPQSDKFSIEPGPGGADKAQMLVLKPFL